MYPIIRAEVVVTGKSCFPFVISINDTDRLILRCLAPDEVTEMTKSQLYDAFGKFGTHFSTTKAPFHLRHTFTGNGDCR